MKQNISYYESDIEKHLENENIIMESNHLSFTHQQR